MRVFIGYDKLENEAYQVARKTLLKTSNIVCEHLEIEKLRAQGLYSRYIDKRGQPYEIISNAPCSTDFAITRFLVPIICQSGWALFTDCDVVFLHDVKELMQYADDSKAVMVVKHNHEQEGQKMGGLQQVSYSRKNWSSVMLFNCSHPANKRLSIHDVNMRPGRDLHAFYWLNDDEIGELPGEWNWLVNVQDRPENPKIAHFTLGGPWINGWHRSAHDEIYEKARDDDNS